MAERDMTGEDHPDLDTPGLARRRAEDPPRIGRLGFGDLGGLDELGGLAGGGGDLANLPPWSVRGEHDGTERPDRDPVALAAWRRVAERRRQRAAEALPETAADPAPDPAPEPASDTRSPRRLAEQALAALEAGALDDESLAEVEAPEPEVEPEVEPVADEPVTERRDDAAAVFAAVLAAAHAGAGEEPAEERPAEPSETPEASEVSEAGDEGVGPWLGARPVEAEVRDAHAGPPGRPSGPPSARGGHDPRPGGGPTDGGRHEVLLSLAGRIDDDALTSVRELVAVEDDAAAAELLGGCLLAAGAGVTATEHAVLGRWFASSRVDPELVDALPRDPEADRRDEHRFTADPPSGAAATSGAGEAVARAAARLPGVQRVQQCWRTTPAGTAPGPVPHRVVLVETHSVDDCEHVAHHVAHAAREHGAVSVEVFAAGAELPAYHRAAVRAARPLDAAPVSGETAVARSTPAPASRPALPLRPRSTPELRPDPAPSWRRAEEEVPSFGVPVGDEVPPFGVAPAATPPGEPETPAGPADEEYRTVASAGLDPLERAERTPPHEPDEAERTSLVTPSTPVTPPEPEPEPAPDPVVPADIDPDVTAERIAALWRVPPPDEILSDDHPISRWTEGPVGPSFGPGEDEPVTTAQEVPPAAPRGEAPVDPDAATGDIPVVEPPAAVNGRVRRARHSRTETGEFEVPAEELVDPPTQAAPAPTNGHRHGPEADSRAGEAATGPVERQDAPATPPRPVEPPEPAAPRPPASSGPDSFDVQLSERERELLARLHEELASRERLAPESPDPLLGRPPAPGTPPGSEDATAPRPRPNGPGAPPPGRPAPRPGPPPGAAGTNGHGPVNGHGLPRRADHDDEDGPTHGA